MIVPVYLLALVVGAWPLFGSLMFKRTDKVDWRKMQSRRDDHRNVFDRLRRFADSHADHNSKGLVVVFNVTLVLKDLRDIPMGLLVPHQPKVHAVRRQTTRV